MSAPHVVLDACVLYPATLRDLLIELACTPLYRAHWTAQIQREWVENLLEQRVDLSDVALERTVLLMDRAVPDAQVRGYEHRTETLTLPDAEDRHVLAAALECGASQIITFNLKDFPSSVLMPLGIEAIHPDNFVLWALELKRTTVLDAIKATRTRLRNPPRSVSEHLKYLRKQGLSKTVNALEPFINKL